MRTHHKTIPGKGTTLPFCCRLKSAPVKDSNKTNGGRKDPAWHSRLACTSAMRLAGLVRWRLPVRVCSPICLRAGVSSHRGTLRASPFLSLCRAGILEGDGHMCLEAERWAGWQGGWVGQDGSNQSRGLVGGT